MRTARFRIAPHQHFILGVQKHHAGGQHRAHALENVGKTIERLPLAHIHHDGRAVDLGRLAHQVREIRQQLQRQIIHGVVAEVFECLQRRCFARPGDARDDHQFLAPVAGIRHASGLDCNLWGPAVA